MTIRAPLHFFSRGEGPPLLLIHGFAGHGAGWRRVAAHLPNSRETAALTLPGHDPACPIPEGAGFEDLVDSIARLLEGEFDLPIEAAGYSLGARVALGLLVRHPGILERATLIGVNPGIADGEGRRERARWDGEWARRIRDEGIEAFSSRWEDLPLFATQRDLPEEVLEEQRAIRLRHDAPSLARAMTALGLAAMPDYRSALPSIRVPVRLVAGEKDTKFLSLAREMADVLRASEMAVLPGVGHNIPLEAPSVLASLLRGGRPSRS
ncbi:MAG: alpha/beta fold hydrolase [Candidatus Eisenbacteria bacterium]